MNVELLAGEGLSRVLGLAAPVPSHRLVVTLGKVSGTDIFDDNTYAHDPREEPKEANGLEFDHDVSEAPGDVLEVAHRHSLGARPGVVRDRGPLTVWGLRFHASY